MDKMHNQSIASNKGVYGEKAVLSICEDFYNKKGGILIHSYSYNAQNGLAGNVVYEDGKLKLENNIKYTEIDVLLVTPFRIYPIEVKSYNASKITLTNDRIIGCAYDHKSPEHQNEMHCRHLYPFLFKAIPDGLTDYIKPIVVFADKTKVLDNRSDDRKEYIKVTILNQLKSLISELDYPINSTVIDLKVMEKTLRNNMKSCEKFLPYLN